MKELPLQFQTIGVQSSAITSRSVSFQSQMEASEHQVLFYFDLFLVWCNWPIMY